MMNLKSALEDLFNLYISKNYFLYRRKDFLNHFLEMSKLKCSVGEDRPVVYTLDGHGFSITFKEYGDVKIKGDVDQDSFKTILRALVKAESKVFKEIPKNLPDDKKIVASILEAMNCFRFKLEHIETFSPLECYQGFSGVTISDGKSKLSFKMISYNTKKLFKKIKNTTLSEKYILGEPYFNLIKINSEGNSSILKKLRELLSHYFLEFNAMNMYEVKLTEYEKMVLFSPFLIVLSKEFPEARSIVERNQKGTTLYLSDEELSWLKDILKKVSQKPFKEILNKLEEEAHLTKRFITFI